VKLAKTEPNPPAKAEPHAPGETEPNPLAAGLERLPVAPTNLVIFGATGDLARRKLLPAIYNLAHEGALPGQFNLIGVSRGEHSNEEYRDIAAQAIRAFSRTKVDESVLSGLLDELRYVTGAFDAPATYTDLAAALAELDEAAGESMSRAFYLSTAPEFFAVIVEALGNAGLAATQGADVRVIIEKPFGTSLAEARELNVKVLSVFQESQVFRIDHYLGKETVQNMLAFRFANGMFEPLWNRNYIANVQITAAEDIGIGSRAGYYDHAGALRDLVENHMMQLLTLLCMEPPVTFAANDVRDEKVKVLHAIRTPQVAELAQMSVRAQYGPGVSGGEPVVGYLQEDGVPADSHTETYAALRLEVDNWRWAGVPFYLRTGKRLARKVTEIAVTLRPVPHLAFEQEGSLGVRPNQLVLTIQPNEGVSLSLGAKIPGTRMRIRPVIMEFLYGTAFLSQSPEAYERLILDAMRGDATLFTRNDEVEAQWRICDPVVSAWEADAGKLPQYAAGTQGPVQANSLLLEGHAWRAI
jgi:glucose-6-phosphate 1-dehydrogenase